MANNKKSIEAVLVIVLLQIFLFWYTRSEVWLYVAVVLGVLSLLFPGIAQTLQYGWMKIAQGIGYVVSRALLTLIYFILLTPLAILSRIFKRKRGVESDDQSFFTTRNYTYSPDSLENVW